MITDRIRPLSRTERGRGLIEPFQAWVAAGERVHASLQAGAAVDIDDLWTELSFAEALAVQLTSHRWDVVAMLLLADASWAEVCDQLPMPQDQARGEFESWLTTRAEFLDCGMYLGLSPTDVRTLLKLIEGTEQ